MAYNFIQCQQGMPLPESGDEAHSAGLVCFAAVTDAVCTHAAEVVDRRKPRDLLQLKWVNAALGNCKIMLLGAHKAFAFSEFAQRYLGAFTYRFKCLLDLPVMVACLVVDV